MPKLTKINVATGIYYVDAPEADVRVLCACPADSVKQLSKRGLIVVEEQGGKTFETGPNAILLSDVPVQNGRLANLAEFPVLQMLYRQGMLLPGHPNNTGRKPLLIGSSQQVKAQMRYIHRGNYGLVREDEFAECGLSPAEIREMLRLKSRLSFGKILPTEQLVDGLIIGTEPRQVRNGLFIRRVSLNVFEFRYGAEAVTVDLNLGFQETYAAPYPLGYHEVGRDYFAVVHSGNADGWDASSPCMSSLLVFQGRMYLIDAGPNIEHILQALGIGVS